MSTAHYILQVNIYLIVFYGCYKVLLDRETYFLLNRIYLLAAGLLSLAIPFLRFEWFATQPVAQPLYVGVDQLNSLMTQVIVAPQKPESYSPGNLIVILYLAGILFFTGKLIWQLLTVGKLLKKTGPGTAFSFFGQKRIDNNLPQLQTIHKHEEVHIRQLHSADVLFFELLGIFTWFNPVVYFYKRSLKNIHEYLADEAAATFQGDKKAYALLLLSSAFGVPASKLTNSFFSKSLIKKRIFMLHKQRSRKTAILKYGMFVPLLALALIMSSATIRNNVQIQQIANEIPLNNPVEVVKEVVTPVLQQAVTERVKTAKKTPQEIALVPAAEKPVQTAAAPDWNNFYKFIKTIIRYPSIAQQQKIQGSTIIKFTIADGQLENIGIAAKLGGGCDLEAMRTITAFPMYKSTMDGNYSIKIKYILSDTNTPKINENTAAPKDYTPLNDIMVVAYGGSETENEDKVYDFVSIDKQPGFEGGMQNFYAYLKKAIRYPAEAQKNNIQGKVFLSFIVERDGTLSDFKVERKLGSGTDEEAIRVLKESPKWTPGMKNGKAVRVKYNIPISFTLNNGATQVPAVNLIGNNSGIIFKDANGGQMKFGDNAANSPLVVIDGKIQDKSDLSYMNPDDIESISVFKDAKGTALYGARAANGVISITTKAGKATKTPATNKKTGE
ncbi:TonB family protein [Pedobacter sp. AK017]|uniref:TonB family protein n=1 Tax=Pedobacter sp. AK017 TaxID=2723073 RepID=UPI00160DDBF8|nr:TonB family protein [Pedobacter sp. AK017]MBB5440125.1 TonB family protein [Pedobacter sp. AK017]